MVHDRGRRQVATPEAGRPRHGHRGPHEFEVSVPRPGENPGWIDAQLAAMRDPRTDTEALLARQEKGREEAWARFALTNVGWSPMFARAAAVVTDMGAPLSHASIVALELGIPAVAGTGNATMRLHDGDRVRVDGERGTVELLT
ncbi:PEP-utilizing enzyme [Nonomuraea cypriaca]|uniref:PEP-utilizing enzyme n=1 Tax=Nonomuraea cypriaca TaxID=1187855 RepID=UPI002E2A08EE|nr:PEP-utilizing enzyme [Nonomuraea cypriaca]